MGYRGKVDEQARARAMRAESMTLLEIAEALGVSKSSVSLWVRDVEFVPKPRKDGRMGGERRPNKLQIAKAEEIERLKRDGVQRIGQLDERDFLIAGIALYAGEGAKGDRGSVDFANSDPRMLLFFSSWLRHFFDIEEERLRFRLYLHVGQDLEAACAFWSGLLSIPTEQFHKPYRAVPDPSIRKNKHPMGCPKVIYTCTRTHRTIMGLVDGLLDCPGTLSGVAQLAERRPVKAIVVGSSPTPGATTST